MSENGQRSEGQSPDTHRKRNLSSGGREKKARRFPWVWVIGLPALALLVWLATQLVGQAGPSSAIRGNAMARRSRTPSPELTSFVEFARASHVPPTRWDERYVDTGLNRLTAALENLAEAGPRDPVVDRRLAELRRRLPDLRAARGSGGNAEAAPVREAFLIATNAMDEIAADRLPGARPLVKLVRDAAESIRADQALAPQMRKVEAFFSQAGYAVTALAPSSAALIDLSG
jgi:hypothetical protein